MANHSASTISPTGQPSQHTEYPGPQDSDIATNREQTSTTPPQRQIRATFDDTTITVYQAYPSQTADAALAAGTFAPPFKLHRMTWIKPSFLWMMYRSGWATKPGQERVLAIRITRAGFEQALASACLSHYDSHLYPSHDDWLRHKQSSPVRVQWDPERSLHLDPLPWRTIQIGLAGTAVHSYVFEWTTTISDVTDFVHDVHGLVTSGYVDAAHQKLFAERVYPLPDNLGTEIGADQP